RDRHLGRAHGRGRGRDRDPRPGRLDRLRLDAPVPLLERRRLRGARDLVRARHPPRGERPARLTPRAAERSVLAARPGLDEPLLRAGDLGLGLGAPDPVRTLDALARLEVLVDLEEVLDLEAVEVRDVVDVLAPRGALVARGDAQHLVVTARLVTHAEHAERTAADEAPGEGRLLEQHEGVERVAVLAESVLDEAVVVGVAGRGEEHAVEADATRLVVDLVLVPLTLGDLDGDVELHGRPSRADADDSRCWQLV